MEEPQNRRAWALAQLGRTLGGRYRLDALRGTGGMGAVYSATHVHVDQPVAVKLLFPDVEGPDSDALREEARHAAAVRSEGVVHVMDFDFDDGAAFLVMELLEGRTLAAQIEADGALELSEARSVLDAVLRALEHVHRAGLVHGDLKPANVFRCDDGATKLLDFGVARAMRSSDSGRRGTPAFMAPEQCAGADADAAFDLYAVGAVAYATLAGRRPYAGLDAAGVIEALADGPPPALAAIDGSLPADLLAWVERAMERTPGARFGSAREMREALEEVAERDAVETLDAAVSLSSTPRESEPTTKGDEAPSEALRAYRGALQPEEPQEPRGDDSRAQLSAASSRRTPWILGGAVGAVVLGALAWGAYPPPRWSMEEPAIGEGAEPSAAPTLPPEARPDVPPTPAPPDRATPLDVSPGDRVLAPFGPRFVFPGTVVERTTDVARVVFADGDVASIPVIDLRPDTIVPGACLLHRDRGSSVGHRACVVQRVRHAVLVTIDGAGTRWTSLLRLFADPRRTQSGLVPYEPPSAEGTAPGARVLANYRRAGRSFVGVVVEQDEAGQRLVVYFDGEAERLPAEDVSPYTLAPGSRVTAAPRRTAVIDPDVGPATVQTAVGDALHLRLDDGRMAWVALSQVRVPRE